MSGALGRGNTTTLLHVDGVNHEVSMDKQVIAKEDTTTLDELFGGDGLVPGLDPDAGVEGGVDPSKDDDNCTGGACKI